MTIAIIPPMSGKKATANMQSLATLKKITPTINAAIVFNRIGEHARKQLPKIWNDLWFGQLAEWGFLALGRNGRRAIRRLRGWLR